MADYPTSLPTFAANGANLSTAPHSALHTDLNNELLAVATELGLSPSDTFSTVKARLDSIAASLATITPLVAWTSYTPAVGQAVAVTSTNTQSRYMRVGRLVSGYFAVAVTSSGTAANIITVTLPVTPSLTSLVCGQAELWDSSAGQHHEGNLAIRDSTNFDFRHSATSGTTNPQMGIFGFTAAIAAGDTLRGTFNYEAA